MPRWPPLAVFLCRAPFRFELAGKALHRLDRPARRGCDLPGIDPDAGGAGEVIGVFDVALVVSSSISLLLVGRTRRRRRACCSMWRVPREDQARAASKLDLPGQLEQQLVGYPVRSKSLHFRRGLIPSWSKPTLVIRDERILSPTEADPIAPGDYIYLLAPPESVEALDRTKSIWRRAWRLDPHRFGDFTVCGRAHRWVNSPIHMAAAGRQRAGPSFDGGRSRRHSPRPRAPAKARKSSAGSASVRTTRRLRCRPGQWPMACGCPRMRQEVVLLTRRQKARRKLAESWASVAGV